MLRTTLLLAGLVLCSRVGLAQDVALVQRPRFLTTAPHEARPVEIDPATAPILQRRVTLALEQTTVGDALTEIGRQAGIRMVYSRDVIDPAAATRIKVDGITVAAALTELLLGRGVDIVLSGGERITLAPRWTRTVRGAVAGRVTDAKTGRGLAGTAVSLEKTRWQATTDTNGRYRLVDVDTGQYTLAVRRVGFAPAKRTITIRQDREDTVDVALDAVAIRLDELVTTATGQQRRRDIGNAVTTIGVDSVMQKAPIRSLTDLLANRVPGLTVQHTSGAPGDPAKLRLRGLGSALRSNDPVVVVDGVRIYATQSAARSGNLTNLAATPPPNTSRPNPVDVPAPSPLDQIDPNIIEKIEVLKGPSAATLYGADAANGVIVITTKHGRPGPTRWDGRVQFGQTSLPDQYPTGYYRWGHNEVTGATTFCTIVGLTCKQDSLVRFQALNDPALTILGRGRRTALSLTASGGVPSLQYSVTGSYSDESGVVKMPDFEIDRFRTRFSKEAPDWMQRPQDFRLWSVTSNVTAQVGPTADVTLLTTLGRSDQQRSTLENEFTRLAGTYVDTVNDVYYATGTLGAVNVSPYFLTSSQDILQNYYTRQTASAITLTTSLNANWHPRAWFSARGVAGINFIPRDDQQQLAPGMISRTDSGSVIRGLGRSLEGTFELQGTVHKALGRGVVFITNIGTNLKTESTNAVVSSAYGLSQGTISFVGARTVSVTEEGSNTSVYGWYIEPAITSQRLSLSTGLRLDGGSAYGARLSRSGGVGLPKLNGSWMISEEPWFPFNSLFASLRLRGAYGQAQVQPGPADRLRLYQSFLTSAVATTAELLLQSLGNSRLRPERSTEFEGGFDADLLDSRVSVELTMYRKSQVDALMAMQLPPSVLGETSILTNVGNIQNTGLDLTLGLIPIRTPALTWSTHLIYNTNNNTVVKLGRDVKANKETGLVEGYPLGGRWALPIIGYADQNGDGVLQSNEIQLGDSMVYMGRLEPAYKMAFSTDVALFRGALGLGASFSYDAGMTQVDQTARTNWVLERALVDPNVSLSQQAAVIASTQPVLGADGQYHVSDYGLIRDVSTFRFTAVSVNYRVPAQVARLLRAQRLTIGLLGANLGFHSTYQGKDPDVNAWSPGENIVDTGQIPQPRTWELSFSLGY